MCNGGQAFEQSQSVVGSDVLPLAGNADIKIKFKANLDRSSISTQINLVREKP